MPVNRIAKKKLPWTYTQFWLFLPTLQRPEGFRSKSATETYKIRRLIPPSGGVKVEACLRQISYLEFIGNAGSEVSAFSPLYIQHWDL